MWSFIGDFIKILQNLSISEHFKKININSEKISETVSNFWPNFQEKFDPIEQHKPQFSENYFLNMQ